MDSEPGIVQADMVLEKDLHLLEAPLLMDLSLIVI